MASPTVEMLSRIVAQLTAEQRQQVLQQCGLHDQQATDSSSADNRPDVEEVLFEIDQTSEGFSMEQLTDKRKRNVKATQAQQTFAYVLRESAKITGLWSGAPLFRDISSKAMDKFISKVMNALPQLNCHYGKKKIRERLSEMLTYRRNHLKNTKFWKRSEKLKKYGMQKLNRPAEQPAADAVSTSEIVQQRLNSNVNVNCQFKQGEDVLVMYGDKKVARAGFLRKSSTNDNYAKLKLSANYLTVSLNSSDIHEKVKLDGPNEEGFLNNLQINKKFYWPMNALQRKGPFKSQRSRGKGSATAAPLPELPRTNPASQTAPPSEPTTPPSEQDHLTPPLAPTAPSAPTTPSEPTTPPSAQDHLTPPPTQLAPTAPTTAPSPQDHLTPPPTPLAPKKKKNRKQKHKGWVYEEVAPNASQENEEALPNKRQRKPAKVHDV